MRTKWTTTWLFPLLCAAAATVLMPAGTPAVRAAAPGETGPAASAPIRVGIIGVDTSHALAFTKGFNAEKPAPALAGIRVVAAFPGGSDDIASSRDRVPKHTELLRAQGVEIVDSIPALLAKVDVVLLESSDGRTHLDQARPVFEAGKPLFIDKPFAGSLADAMAIAELGRKHNVPWFSCSALRFAAGVQKLRNDDSLGPVQGCAAYSPCVLEPTHPDLFWYGVHGVEILYTFMGPGCESVSRASQSGTDHATGVWRGGRIGTFRGIRDGKADYGATVFGSKRIDSTAGFGGYGPMLDQIATFFRTGKPPVPPEETLEMFAFMEAADASKRQDGKPVTLESVRERARAELEKRAK